MANNPIKMTWPTPGTDYVRTWRYGSGALYYTKLNTASEFYAPGYDTAGRVNLMNRFNPVAAAWVAPTTL